MTILFVSCCYQGGLFRLDTETGAVDQFGDTRPGTGLAHYQGRLAQVVGGNEVWIVSKYRSKVLKRHKLAKEGREHYHDLKFSSKHALIVNTDRSRVDFYDSRTWEYQGHSLPLTPRAMEVVDACHFNTICIEPTKGGLFGAAFALTEEEQGWRPHIPNNMRGLVFYVGAKRIVPLIEGFQHPHSLCIIGEHAWLCNSIPGELIVFKRDNRIWTPLKTWHVGSGFTRGFALGNDGYYYVGLSVNRHPEVYHFPEHDNYTLETARVVQLNYNGEILNHWDIPSPEIYDIVVDNDF
jgi:hypothetical protein